MHDWIANSRWRGKRSGHSRCMRNPPFCVPGKRTMALICHVCCAHIGDVVSSTIAFSYVIGGWKRYYILLYRDPFNWFYCMLHVYNRCSLTNPRLSFVMDQIHNAHSAPVPYLTMYTFLFWMAHCGLWNRRIVFFSQISRFFVLCCRWMSACLKSMRPTDTAMRLYTR